MTTSDDSVEAAAWSVPAIDPTDTPAARSAAEAKARKTQFAEARQKGFDEGFREGKAKSAELATALAAALAHLEAPLAALDDEVEEALVDLACRIAKQVVRRELQLDRGAVVAITREALAALPLNARDIKVSLHPDDADILRESLVEADANPKWTLLEDPLMSRGDVRVLSERSQVDATVNQRLTNIIGGLADDERASTRGADHGQSD